MKKSFNKQFIEAFNEKYDYHNEEFENKIKVEKPIKNKPKLSYSLKLIFTTMIITLCICIVSFRIWINEQQKENNLLKNEIMQIYNVSQVYNIGSYDCRDFTIEIYRICKDFVWMDTIVSIIYKNSNDINSLKLCIVFEDEKYEYIINSSNNLIPLNINTFGDLYIDVLINGEVKLNFIQNLGELY